MQLYFLDPVFLCLSFLANYYETDLTLHCAWSSILELGQAHYKYNLLLLSDKERNQHDAET